MQLSGGALDGILYRLQIHAERLARNGVGRWKRRIGGALFAGRQVGHGGTVVHARGEQVACAHAGDSTCDVRGDPELAP